MTVRELGVWLADKRVATLRAPRIGRIVCRYAPQTLDEFDLGLPLLSCSLPVRTHGLNAWAFASGLLPEGHHRQAMAAHAGVAAHDVFGMLARFGRDVAGAVVLSEQDPPLRSASVATYTDETLEAAVDGLQENPLALDDDAELSIAGLQDKMLLVEMPGGRWGRPQHGYPSTHILKVDDRQRPGLIAAEHACLQLARAAGLHASESRLVTIGATECLAVRRFDRQAAPDGAIRRTHQEDACQALGIDPEAAGRRAKCERHGGPRLRDVARLLDAWAASPKQQLRSLLEWTVFTVVIGNADAHGKNLALLHPTPGHIELAPLYDTVPTILWPRLRTTAAMSIGGATELPDIALADIVTEAEAWSMPAARAGQIVGDTCERLRTALTTGHVDDGAPAMQLAAKRIAALVG
jgi:serine/threonine-protein kinase HipA